MKKRSLLQAIRTDQKSREINSQELLREEYDAGDPTLKRTITGRITRKKIGGLVIRSAEGVKFSHSDMPLTCSRFEEPIVRVEIINDGHVEELHITNYDGSKSTTTVPTRPLVDPSTNKRNIPNYDE